MDRRFFSDLTVGETHNLGSVTVSRAALIEFGEQFDPQAYYVDTEQAKAWDGLIASGFHTAALGMRLAVEGFLRDIATIGGRGVDELR
jgi:acyl dehydratase